MELLDKAKQVVEKEENIPQDKELMNYIKGEYGINNRRQLAFIVEYIKNGGKVVKAYKLIYGQHITKGSAGVLGCKILKKISVGELLEFMGHGLENIDKAMTTLLTKDPANYMKYQAQFRKWDTQEIKHSGSIDIPPVVFTSQKVDDDSDKK